MKIQLLKNAQKSLLGYDKSIANRLLQAIKQIPQGDIKRLKGNQKPPLYRLRVGKYRIVYHFDNNQILIVKIDTRGDVYK